MSWKRIGKGPFSLRTYLEINFCITSSIFMGDPDETPECVWVDYMLTVRLVFALRKNIKSVIAWAQAA